MAERRKASKVQRSSSFDKITEKLHKGAFYFGQTHDITWQEPPDQEVPFIKFPSQLPLHSLAA